MFIRLLILILLLSGQAYGAPSISSFSGTVDNGSSITISGSGFGTKSPAAPLLWDTFESGTSGNTIQNVAATVGTWGSGSGSDAVFYTDTTGYGGSGKAARHTFESGGVYNSSLSLNGTYPTLFIDFKRFVTEYSGNYKPFRLFGNNDTLQFYSGYGCSTGTPYTVLTMEENSVGNVIGYPTASIDNSAWDHYQIIYKESTAGVSDGYARQLFNISNNVGSNAVQTRDSSAEHFEQIRIGHYYEAGERDGCTTSSPISIYTDNVYVDTTWSRVEIGDAATYTGCTKREIQIPTAWADGSTTVTVNTGSFATSASAYLYVTDSTGTTSAGYPITIGGNGGGTVTCYPDIDNDLYPGSGSETVSSCSTNYYEIGHFTAMTADCNDNNYNINPGASDSTCDGIDQDCSGGDNCTPPTGTVKTGSGGFRNSGTGHFIIN